MADDHSHDDEDQGEEEAGDHAGQKTVADGDARAGHEAIEDHGHAGRDHDPQAGGNGDGGGGEITGITLLQHTGDQNGAHGGAAGDGRAGNGAEKQGDQHRHNGQAALKSAHQGGAELHQPAGDAALGHDIAGQDKEGQGQVGEGVDAGKHFLGDPDHGHGGIGEDGQYAGQTQGEHDGHSDGKADQKDDIRHAAGPPFIRSRMLAMILRNIIPMPMGMHR